MFVCRPSVKEPGFFTRVYAPPEQDTCSRFPGICGAEPDTEISYITKVLCAPQANFSRATYEASASTAEALYAMRGVRKEMPWVKAIFTLREPISRAISGVNHRYVYKPAQNMSCLFQGGTMPHCVEKFLQGGRMVSCVCINTQAHLF